MMAEKFMWAEKIELFIITYNRAKYLERTLAQLLASPFAACRITVLDNCSPDETPEVCRRFAEQFAQMRIVRHVKNIGAGPNYLRAVEMSRATYTWVLGDDDMYDFAACADVLEVIESERFDLISLGSPAQLDDERGLETTSRALIERGTRYFSSFTFLTGVAFRTELFDSECFFHGYRNVVNLYPHFEFVRKSVEHNFSVYTSQHQIVERNHYNEDHLTYIRWFIAWVYCCATIKDRQLRRKAIYDFSYRTMHYHRMAFAISTEKANGYKTSWGDIIAVWRILCREQKLLWMLYSPLFLVPAFVYRGARTLNRHRYQKLSGKAVAERQAFDHFRL